MYTCTETIIGKITEKDEYNPYNSVGAAVLTGAIFKSTGKLILLNVEFPSYGLINK